MTDKPSIPSDDEASKQAPAPDAGGGALLESPEGAAERLARELAELNDRHLRLAAEYDNFRKRTTRERTELWATAQADLVARLVDALDDLTRFAHVDPVAVNAKALREGVELVERKLWKELEAARVERIDKVDIPFDPAVHEAVTTAPTTDRARDHTVAAVLQPGYKLGDRLLRPARVQVLTFQGGAT